MITKQQLLDYLKNDVYVRVGPSKIHGVGLIAVRDIPKGINPFKNLIEPETYEVTAEDLKEVPPQVVKMVYDYFGVEDGTVFLPITGMNPMDLLHYINHSDDANVKVLNEGWLFETTRDVKEGEELTSNYSTYDDPGFKEKF
jgi:SET domain-containing protein